MTEETKGQRARKNIQLTIIGKLSKYCPNTFSKMANLIAFDFNLTPDTVRYNYLSMFIDAEILEYNNDRMLILTAKGKGFQTNEDGSTVNDTFKKSVEEINDLRREKKK
jgi:hypothetical protein